MAESSSKSSYVLRIYHPCKRPIVAAFPDLIDRSREDFSQFGRNYLALDINFDMVQPALMDPCGIRVDGSR